MPISGTDLTEVIDWMKSEAPLKPFNQGEFRKAVGMNFTNPERDMSGGYCAGVCIDWIRRVLLGGRITYDPNKVKAQTAETEQQRQSDSVSRMAHAWAGPVGKTGGRELTFVTDTSSSKALLLAELRRMEARPFDLIPPSDDSRKLFLKFYTESYKISSNQGDAFKDTHWSKPLLAEMIKDIDGRANLKGESKWADFAPFLNTIYSEQRSARGKTGKRPFTGIDVEDSSQGKTYEHTGLWTRALKGMIKNDRCALLGVTDAASKSGHAVAIRAAMGSYDLFDPNFGVFACKDWDTLENFLYMLFGNFKLTVANKTIVGPVYGNTVEKNVDWTVFRKAAATQIALAANTV